MPKSQGLKFVEKEDASNTPALRISKDIFAVASKSGRTTVLGPIHLNQFLVVV
jgi:hypothetical protein